jgi:hypothetical protein
MNEIMKKWAFDQGIRNVPLLKNKVIEKYGRVAMRAATKANLGEELAAGISATLKNMFKREQGQNTQNGQSGQSGQNASHQPDFSSICPDFDKMRPSYYVPSRHEYVKKAELVKKLEELDEARKYLWSKIAESRAEAELLDRVYSFLKGQAGRPAAS